MYIKQLKMNNIIKIKSTGCRMTLLLNTMLFVFLFVVRVFAFGNGVINARSRGFTFGELPSVGCNPCGCIR